MKHRRAITEPGRWRRLLLTVVAGGALLLAAGPPPALARHPDRPPASSSSPTPEVEVPEVTVHASTEPGPLARLGALVLSPPYFVAKLLYAGTGAVFGGALFVLTLGDRDLAQAVWTESLKGDYVLRPEHLAGDRPIRFVVPPDDDPPIQLLETPRAG